MIARSIIGIVRKDWFEHINAVVLLTSALLAFVLFWPASAFKRGFVIGLVGGMAYVYPFLCFSLERQRRTLYLLLDLPIRPRRLVIAKYASVHSMVFFTTNLPAPFMSDAQLLLRLNAFALFLSTLSMAFATISDKDWVHQIPVGALVLYVMPLRTILELFPPAGPAIVGFASSRMDLWTSIAFGVTPLIVVISARHFEKQVSR